MESIRKYKLEKLQQKINELNNLYQEKLEQEAKKDYQLLKIKAAISPIIYASIISIILKLMGFGYPIVEDDIKVYQEIQTTIDEFGNITKEKAGYNCEKWGV